MAEGRVLGGRYELRSPLGRGGMAEVWLGTDRVLGRQVAVKILGSDFARDDSFVARFRREAQSAAALNHPNVVGVFDTGSDDGTHYIVMEYVAGRTLADILSGDTRLQPERAVEIADAVSRALAFAHSEGLVHRDVKPANIMLTERGDVKLTDFGIARATASDSITRTATVLGTAAYFSPEQAQGHQVDARSDVYSLGCVLYEMVCGRPPFTADSPLAVAYQHVRDQPRPPRELNPDVPPGLEAIILRCLAKDPAARYASAEALRHDLQRFRSGRRISAPPPPAAATTSVVPRPASTEVVRRTGPATSVLERELEEEEAGRRWIPVVAIVVGVLVVLGVVLFFVARELTGRDLLTVPDVRGMPRAAAEQRLRDAGFVPRLRATEPNQDVERDRVIDYEPKEAERGAEVFLTVSAGPEVRRVTIPDILCATHDEAVLALEDLNLVVEEGGEETNEDCAEEGVVARTDPEPGSEVDEGSTVTIFLTPALPVEPPSRPDLAPGSDSGVSNEDNITNQTSLTFGGTAPPGATVRLFRDGAEVASGTADGSGSWSLTDPGPASDGPHAYTARAEDADGGTSQPSEGLEVVVDTRAPDTTIVSGPEDEVDDDRAEFEFEADEDGAAFACSLDDEDFVPCTSPQEYRDLETGPHTFAVFASDAAGNSDDSPATQQWVVID